MSAKVGAGSRGSGQRLANGGLRGVLNHGSQGVGHRRFGVLRDRVDMMETFG